MAFFEKYDLFDTGINDRSCENTKYSINCKAPQYLPKNEKPLLWQLVDDRKYKTLVSEIERSSLPSNEKDFLKLAATRFILFNYAKIADYYANSDKQTQEMMEKLALVIIDIEDAIANGFVKLNKEIEDIAKTSIEYQDRLNKYKKEAEE